MATKALVGEFADGWRRMLGHDDRSSDWGLRQCGQSLGSDGRCPGPERLFATDPEALRAFLRQNGYLPATGATGATGGLGGSGLGAAAAAEGGAP